MATDVLGHELRSSGWVLIHEHVQFGWPGADLDFLVQNGSEAELSRDAEIFAELADRGCGIFVDATPMECQRDLGRLAAIARQTSVQIVGATGLYHARSGYPTHFATLEVDELAEIYERDIRGENRDGVPTGVIKVATGLPPFAKREEKALRAAARASIRTDAPIVSHAESAAAATEQHRIFREEGLASSRAVLGHLDAESPDDDSLVSLAKQGAYLGIDRCGHETFAPHASRIELLAMLKRRGVLEQVLLSHDAVLRFVGRRQQADDNPFLKIQDRLLPMLETASFTAAEVNGLTRTNAERFLGIIS